ncbi:putative cinnamoyl-CoA reductase, partial [Aureobasidium melanogenum]
MSKPASQQTILVTGASGFMATHIVSSFLSAGYNVRGTVRSQKSAEGVKKSHPEYASQISFAIVPDIAAPNAFDEAVKDVDGVIHNASPFAFDVKDNEKELLNPAIQGTKGCLEAVKKFAPKVKRVVVTSSFASIVDMSKGTRPGYTYTEEDWNPCTYEEAKKGDGAVAYCASKAFAERAAWEFGKDPEVKFDVVTICPPMVYGPPKHAVPDMKKLNTSSADIYRFINGSTKEPGDTGFPLCVDVRDVGTAHLKAYEVPEASNQRFAVTSGNFTYQRVCDIIRAKFPELKDKVPEGNPGEAYPDFFGLSNEKAKKVLGMQFIGLEEMVVDTVKSLLELEKAAGENGSK